jgi:hypothetical protein
MRLRVGSSGLLVRGDASRFLLLIAAAWLAGLVVVLLFAMAQPAHQRQRVANSGRPSGDAGVLLAGRRWTLPAEGGMAGATDQLLAGRRWTLSVATDTVEVIFAG